MFLLKYTSAIGAGIAVGCIAVLLLPKLNRLARVFIFLKGTALLRDVREKRRLKKIDGQLTCAITMLANALKAGLGLQQAVIACSLDAPEPVREEFKFVVSLIKVGKGIDDALLKWKERLPLPDVVILVESVVVLRQTGGNLVETFMSIAETIRERQKIAGRIRVITSRGMMQAGIMLALPFFLCAALYVVAPWYITPLITEPLGWAVISAGLILQALGTLWLKKICTIKI